MKLARNIDRESIGDGLRISRSALSLVGEDMNILHTGDALADPRLSIHESIRRGRIRSLIALPLTLGDKLLGAIYMDHRELTDLFGREERIFLRFIADMAAIGIRNAQRFEIAEDQARRNLRGELEEEEFVFPRTIVGRGKTMQDLVRKGIRAARSGKLVCLTGENGVGKDHLAKILHEEARLEGDFVSCPLPTIPSTLIASELFGTVEGVATGVASRAGYVEAAEGGTLFLNEIGELSSELQAVLLHFIETRQFTRVGGTSSLKMSGLIVCATNVDLQEKVAEGTFREDLYFRLTECILEIPPLRERSEDIPEFVDLFLREFEERLGAAAVVHPLAMDLLLRCRWEGNVRELRHAIANALDATDTNVIERQHLDSPSLRKARDQAPAGTTGVREEVETMEIQRIREAMNRSGGIITRSARLLGLSEAALRRRIRRYQLEHLVLHRKPRR